MPWRMPSLRDLLGPPDLQDAGMNARATNIHFTALIISACLAVWLPFGTLVVGSSPQSLYLGAGMLLACVVSFALLRTTRLKLAGIVLAAAIFVQQTMLFIAHPTIGSVSYGGYLLVVVTTGFIAGGRVATLAALGAVFAGGVVVFWSPFDRGGAGGVLIWTAWCFYLAIAALKLSGLAQ